MPGLPAAPFIYPLTDRQLSGEQDIAVLVRQLCSAGVRLIQIREKDSTTREFTGLARRAVTTAAEWGATVIVNDRADVAASSGAHGVHLGDEEIPVHAARAFLGEEAIIGLSCHSLDDVREAITQPIDYFAVGPVFGTTSKESRFADVGLDLIRQARQLTSLPMVAIGGITAENLSEVFDAGASGAAVIGAAMQQGRVESATRELIEIT